VAPLGHPRPIRTIVDLDLARFGVVWAAAGHAHTVFPTSFAEIVAMTGGRALAVVPPVTLES
jgi:prolyl-tRNA editing enzyme YbaK/EbsC (Cys-tRNA(Pro) deacylase)